MNGHVTIAIDLAQRLLDLMREFRRDWPADLTPARIGEIHGENEAVLAAKVDGAIHTLAAMVSLRGAVVAAPADQWPFTGHRTMAQVMAEEGGAA